jgi:hypothetical protein
MISREMTAKVLIQEQERWYVIKRLLKSWFKNKNDDDDISWNDWKSLDSKTRTMISHKNTVLQKSWFKKERWYLIKRQQKSCSRTITMISREMTAKVFIQEQERWRWYIMKRLQKSWIKNKNDDMSFEHPYGLSNKGNFKSPKEDAEISGDS